MLFRWWREAKEETRAQIEEGKEAATTGEDRLNEVRELANKSAQVRRADQNMRDRNRFVQTFWKAFEEGLR